MKYSIANAAGRPLEIDGLSLKEGERIDDLDGISDEVQAAADRGELMILPTPPAYDRNAVNVPVAPGVSAPSIEAKTDAQGVIVNPVNPDAGEPEGQRQDPRGAAGSSTAQQDVSVSDPAVPGSVSAAELKQPISTDPGEIKSFADFSAAVDKAEAEGPAGGEEDLAAGVRKPRK